MKVSFAVALSFIPGAIAALALSVLYAFPGLLVFLGTVAIWWIFIVVAHFFFSLSKIHLLLHLSTSFSLISLLSLVEWQFLVVLIVFLSVFFFSFIWRLSTEKSRLKQGLEYKMWRRIVMMLWVFNAYAWLTMFFSLPIFFQQVPSLLISVAGGACAALAAIMIWRLYFNVEKRAFVFWGVITAVIMFEVMWSMHYLSLGYFSLGLLATWLWYMLQLFIRFNMTKGGILWKKQYGFLAMNAVLFAITLSLVRWI